MGHEIKSPNQTLSAAQIIDADGRTGNEPVEELKFGDVMFCVAVTPDNKAKLLKIVETNKGIELLDMVKEESFPNKHQAFMRLNYWLQKIELGSIK